MEAGIGIEPRPLLGDRRRQARMGMAERRDIVDHVEKAAALHVEQEFAPAALDLRRHLVIVLLRLGVAGIAQR